MWKIMKLYIFKHDFPDEPKIQFSSVLWCVFFIFALWLFIINTYRHSTLHKMSFELGRNWLLTRQALWRNKSPQVLLITQYSPLPFINVLTCYTAPHIRPQVLSVGAGACVFRRVFCNLRRLKTQVLAASVSHTTQITAVWAWRQ